MTGMYIDKKCLTTILIVRKLKKCLCNYEKMNLDKHDVLSRKNGITLKIIHIKRYWNEYYQYIKSNWKDKRVYCFWRNNIVIFMPTKVFFAMVTEHKRELLHI